MNLSYVLPLRCDAASHAGHPELDEYIRSLSGLVEMIVVDGSSAEAFRDHRFGNGVVHLAPDAREVWLNGKVSGVMTGVRAASHERVVIADDDVRYDAPQLKVLWTMLGDADLVLPQNVFEPMPWHACWDTSRTLINRAFRMDYAGTLGLRRASLLRAGGYNGDVLFENLELIRTIRANGGRVRIALDLIVARRPPTFRIFREQRVRQAFDDLAQPLRLATFLSIVPVVLTTGRRHAMAVLFALAGIPIALAEIGRRRSNGTSSYPVTASLIAPLWILERSITVWVALSRRFLLGGIRYRDARIRTAATSMRSLRHKALERVDPRVSAA